MKLIFGVFVYFAVFVVSNPIDICGMTEKELSQLKISLDTEIHFPFKWDLTCKEFIDIDPHARASFGLCRRD